MVYLAVAVAVVGVLGLVNLVFILGVVRRLREYEQLLSGGGGDSDRVALAESTTVGEFMATTTAGEQVSEMSLTGRTLVAFSSVSCGPCRQLLPTLVSRAAEWEGGRANVLTVVVGGGKESAEFVEQLEPVAQVVVEPERGPVSTAFAVRGFPAYLVVGADGTVQASGYSLNQVLDRVPA
jgi:hypothetical protein